MPLPPEIVFPEGALPLPYNLRHMELKFIFL